MNQQGNYSLTDEEYKFLEEHFQKPELLWKYKRALEEADEEKQKKENTRKQLVRNKMKSTA